MGGVRSDYADVLWKFQIGMERKGGNSKWEATKRLCRTWAWKRSRLPGQKKKKKYTSGGGDEFCFCLFSPPESQRTDSKVIAPIGSPELWGKLDILGLI